MSDITIFHKPASSAARKVLALIRHAGQDPRVGPLPPFTKSDGELVHDNGKRRG